MKPKRYVLMNAAYEWEEVSYEKFRGPGDHYIRNTVIVTTNQDGAIFLEIDCKNVSVGDVAAIVKLLCSSPRT
jgi:hypothetical protein